MRAFTRSFLTQSRSISLNRVFRGSFAISTPKTTLLAKANSSVNVSPGSCYGAVNKGSRRNYSKLLTEFLMHSTRQITINSITNTLAYIQNYTPKYLLGRCLTVSDLSQLAVWLECKGQARSLRQQPHLAIHFALLLAAKLINHNEWFWFLTPAALSWLAEEKPVQIESLLNPFSSCHLKGTIEALNLEAALPIDRVAFYQQQLVRLQNQPQLALFPATWQLVTEDEWHLCLPPTLAPPTRFHLLQYGEWLPESPLIISSRTIAKAAQQGHGLMHMGFYIEKATNQTLPVKQQKQLFDWYHRSEAISIETVNLLTTRQPEDLASLINNGNFRPYIIKQLSSRHATITTEGIIPLSKWAAKRGYNLSPGTTAEDRPTPTPTAYQWLGLNLLVCLSKLIPTPYPPPHAELAALSQTLSAAELTAFAQLTEKILVQLKEAVQGRDAFFSASQSPTPFLIEQIHQAIEQQTTIQIAYLALFAAQPSYHELEPLRLEKRGALYYLHAYSLRTEGNLTFRLDRIQELITPKADTM
jgi:hypothetical protein